MERQRGGERHARSSPQKRPASREGASVVHLLKLQRLAGNRAVGELLQGSASVQRTMGDGHDLTSPRFAGQVLLEKTFDDEARVTTGSDSDAVKRIQQALVDAGPVTGRVYDIGKSGPAANGVDGDYGPKTTAAVKKFQKDQSLPSAPGHVGPGTMAKFNSLFPGTTPPPPPPPAKVFKLGDKGPEVAQAQQKLNALLPNPPYLSINGVLGPETAMGLFLYQLKKGISPPNGNLDQRTIDALNADVRGGGKDAAGIENPVDNPRGAQTLGKQVPGTSLHPTVGAGAMTTGPAVREVQQKLNIWNANLTVSGSPLAEDSNWKSADTARLTLFQALHGIFSPLGVTSEPTWAALDKAGAKATSGYIERQWTEVVGGKTFKQIGGTASKYSWSLDAASGGGQVMNVTAKVSFSKNPPNPGWPGLVTAAWNKFAAQDAVSGEKINLDFNLVSGSGSDAHAVVVETGNGRANAGQWFLGDTRAAFSIPHEYGHLIGLSDEYQLHPGDYREVTGHEPPVGDAAGPAGITPQKMAKDMQDQMVLLSASGVHSVSVAQGLTMGAYAQQVAQAYAALPPVTLPPLPAILATPTTKGLAGRPAMTTTGRIVEDLDVGIRDDAQGHRYDVIQALTYSSGSLMGDPGRVTDHDHGGAQPRHVQQFVEHIARIKGGAWNVVTR